MLSVSHLIIIFVVVLVVFGPQKLPELARNLGKLMAEFRKASADFKMSFEEEMRNLERQTREAEWKKNQAAAATLPEAPPPALPAPLNPEVQSSSGENIAPVIAPVSEAIPRSLDGGVSEEAAASAERANPAEPFPKNALHDHQQPV